MKYKLRKQKMPSRTRQYSFKIDAYTPDTIPMERLAEYMRELAKLLGEAESVHFIRVEKGSLRVLHKVEFEAIPKVEERITKARQGDGPVEAVQAIRNINRKLREDNGSGILARQHGATIVKFPGREETPISFGIVSQEGSLDGFVNVVGGDTDPCPVHLKSSDDGQVYLCDASRSVAKELGKNMFDVEIRAHGLGKWFRDDEGRWALERFRIRSFETLKDLPLSAVVADLRSTPGSEWPAIKEPFYELERIRRGPEKNGHK